MIKLSNSKLLSIFFKLLLLVLVAKSISLIFLFLLPSDGEELSIENNYQPKYQRIDFSNMIFNEKITKETKDVTSVSTNALSISNMVLKGLYGTKNSGFVIVALKSTPAKTTIVGVGEVYSGYTLIHIASKNATFEKNSKEYILWLDMKSETSDLITLVTKNKTKVVAKELSQKTVTRDDISFYAKNPKQIWKEISIVELKENGKIKGFKITKIDSKSKMATLGLQKGDVIIKANNVVLKSYRDALNIYTNIKDIDVMQIVVIRNGIEKEIVYEIN